MTNDLKKDIICNQPIDILLLAICCKMSVIGLKKKMKRILDDDATTLKIPSLTPMRTGFNKYLKMQKNME